MKNKIRKYIQKITFKRLFIKETFIFMKDYSNYKGLAFFDLDGTLLNSKSQLDQEVIEALSRIRENGILPFIATGRGPFELKHLINNSGINGAVSMNGQFIMLDGEVIYKEEIPTPVITKLLDVASACNEAIAFYDDSHYWVSELTKYATKAYEYARMPLPLEKPHYYLKNEVNMLLVLTDKLSQQDYYKEAVPELNFYMNSPSSIDVTNISTNKGTGVAHVKNLLGIKGPSYGFGDGRNDFALLSACDNKTAMGNAVHGLKEIADFVTTANTDHGIINAFKHWEII